jgi:hypothetical protein
MTDVFAICMNLDKEKSSVEAFRHTIIMTLLSQR